MRKFHIMLLFLLIMTANLSAKINWERVVSKSTEASAYDGSIDQISCIDSMNCKALVCANAFFRLLSSRDGGKTWSVMHDETIAENSWDLPRPYMAFVMAYLDSNNIFVSRDCGVISHSRDGGRTYDTLRLLSPKDSALIWVGDPTAWLRNFSMCDTLTGLTSHSKTRNLLITTDGWETWKKVNTLPAKYGIGNAFCNTMHMFDKDNFLVYTPDKGLSRTTDGGQTWHFCKLPFADFDRMRFKDRDLGYAVGSSLNGKGEQRIGYIVKTMDGGFTWETILVDDKEPIFGLLDVDFRDDSVGIAVGKYGKLYETYDGGGNLGDTSSS